MMIITLDHIADVLANSDPRFIESLAARASEITVREFGRTISLYAPLYLSNFCENQCLYCGFNTDISIKRKKLAEDEMRDEMETLAKMGFQNILLLTGESRQHTPVEYLIQAVKIAQYYFPSISLEVYPMAVEEYHQLFLAGVDGVTLYQETYNRDRYLKLHLAGKKRDYDFRFMAPERMAEAGIRSVSMGVLLGLAPVADDICHLFRHVRTMEKRFPGVEYNVSFPRLIPLKNSESIDYYPVTDELLVKLICLARILFPRIGINLSTREVANFRNHAIEFGITRISAASRTTVGGYVYHADDSGQFDVQDKRSLKEVVLMLKQNGFDPVFTDWRHIPGRSV